MLREGESKSLLALLPYSLLFCALGYFAYERFGIAYGAEVDGRKELLSQSGGKSADRNDATRIGQVRKRRDVVGVVRKEYDAASAQTRAAVATLPSTKQVGRVIQLLHELARKSRCAITAARQETEIADKLNPDLLRIRFGIHLRGGYSDLRGYVAALESGRHVLGGRVQLKEISFQRPAVGDGVDCDVLLEILGRTS